MSGATVNRPSGSHRLFAQFFSLKDGFDRDLFREYQMQAGPSTCNVSQAITIGGSVPDNTLEVAALVVASILSHVTAAR
jgi:hypothetical protein